MDDAVRQALTKGHVIDITTTGRKSGEARRIEIAFHVVGGKVYISGFPRPGGRFWLRNLRANPEFTFHLKQDVQADLRARARIIDGEAERRALLPEIAKTWGRDDIDFMVEMSPLIEVTFLD